MACGGEGGGLGLGGGAGLRARTSPGPEKLRPARSPTSPRGRNSHPSHTSKASARSSSRRRQPRLGEQDGRFAAAASPPATRSAFLSPSSRAATATGARETPVGNVNHSRLARALPAVSESNVIWTPSVPMLLALPSR